MCPDCARQRGKDRYQRGHANLTSTGHREMRSMMGAVDEADYLCRVCGTEWIKETGSHGMGWVDFPAKK